MNKGKKKSQYLQYNQLGLVASSSKKMLVSKREATHEKSPFRR
jgi:hypothetical protein